MPFNCKYAIFDNDGTLMESMYYWRLAAIEYMIAHRLPIPGEMTLREMFSHSSRAFSEDIARYEPGASFESVVACLLYTSEQTASSNTSCTSPSRSRSQTNTTPPRSRARCTCLLYTS